MTDSYSKGLQIRREVMGDAFVDKALGNASEFTQPLQDHINAHAWGAVWPRDGLDRKSRSMVTVAMLTALGRHHELTGHVRGALNNGVKPEEIQEILLHATVYCGVPAAAEAFRAAEPVVAAWKAENAGQ